MKELHFEVEGQIVRPVDKNELKGIVRGSKGYLKLCFSFKDKESRKTVISFYDVLMEKQVNVKLDCCDCVNVPDEVTKDSQFSFILHGKVCSEQTNTNRFIVKQL